MTAYDLFPVGTRVRVIDSPPKDDPASAGKVAGMTGRIVDYDFPEHYKERYLAVEFDLPVPGRGHSCMGAAKMGHGWNVICANLVRIDDTPEFLAWLEQDQEEE